VADAVPQIVITLDGYSAPISAGNFVVNVLDGLYENK
jgi:cyclophilin family peptidyl-prolyl cis-trans isomerase